MTYHTVLAALADPTRRAVFVRLLAGPSSVAEIASTLPVTRPAVSQHLKALAAASLARVTRRGTRNIYAVNTAGLEALAAWLDQCLHRPVPHLDPQRQHGEV